MAVIFGILVDMSYFFQEFRRHQRNEAQVRNFLIRRFDLSSDVTDADAAAVEPFLAMPKGERERFKSEWYELLDSLKK